MVGYEQLSMKPTQTLNATGLKILQLDLLGRSSESTAQPVRLRENDLACIILAETIVFDDVFECVLNHVQSILRYCFKPIQ